MGTMERSTQPSERKKRMGEPVRDLFDLTHTTETPAMQPPKVPAEDRFDPDDPAIRNDWGPSLQRGDRKLPDDERPPGLHAREDA